MVNYKVITDSVNHEQVKFIYWWSWCCFVVDQVYRYWCLWEMHWRYFRACSNGYYKNRCV